MRGSLLVLGTPSFGMVGTIATHFLMEQLRMQPIGMFTSDDIAPVGMAWQGVVTGPIQVFTSPEVCGLDGTCTRLLALNSDIPLLPQQMMPLASRIATWASEAGIGLLVGLEGYPAPSATPNSHDVLIASSWEGEATAKRLEAKPVHATLTGFNAALLVAANRQKLAALGLFAVSSGQEDSKAAASLLHLLGPLLPTIKLDAQELAKRAEGLESRLRADHVQHLSVTQKLEESVDRSYT